MIEAGTRIGGAIRSVNQLLFNARLAEMFSDAPAAAPEAPAPVATDPLKNADIADLLHPDIWVDGFTVAQIAEMTGRKAESYESEVRGLVNRGVLRVDLPAGSLSRNPALPRPDTFHIPTRSGGFKGFV